MLSHIRYLNSAQDMKVFVYTVCDMTTSPTNLLTKSFLGYYQSELRFSTNLVFLQTTKIPVLSKQSIAKNS